MVQATSDQPAFEAGKIFAGRYRLVHRLRSSRSREVWRADDLGGNGPVSLEIVEAADDRHREEVRRQIQLVRGLRHAAICRVADAGEAGGRIYCALELVDGESLRTLLRRADRLLPERVADIGRQLCAGLSVLRTAGLDTPLDPWTALIDPGGSVRIADFGLGLPVPARSGVTPDAAAATPWARGEAYAVGAVLYGLLVGATPEGRDRIPSAALRPSALVPNVDPRLERVILDALADDPRKRPSSAAAMMAALTPLPGSARVGWLGWAAAAGAVTAVAGTLALLAAWLVPGPADPLTAHDTLVLADFENTTENPVFDGALKVALAVALEQSPFLRIYPDERARDTLRLMQRPPEERITAGLAREIARREQLKALVAGSISPLGSHYLLTIQAVAADTGKTIAQQHVEVPSADDVLRSLGAAAARLRGQLGESLASIQRFDAPLPQATTPSLEALHAYWLAHDRGQLVPRVEAIPHLRRAIDLDARFAMAYAALSGVYRNTGRSAEAPEFSRRAFELRDRVSERERFFISWRYFIDAAQAWDKALDLSVSWTRSYPREAFAFNSLGLASAAFGDHEQAVHAFAEAIRLDPGFVPPHGNLAGSLIASNRFADARAALSQARERGIAFITLRRMAYLLAFIEGDRAAMERELDLLRQSSDAVWALIFEARTAAFAERTRLAHDLFQRGVADAASRGAQELAAQWTAEDAEAHAVAGECSAAQGEAHAALRQARDNFTIERAARVLAVCGDEAGAAQAADDLRRRFAEATLTVRIHLPVIAALADLRQGRPAAAVERLEPVGPFDHAPSAEFWPAYVRGEAYLQMKDGRAAAAQFRAILDHRGQAPTSPLYAVAARKLAAAEALSGVAVVPAVSAAGAPAPPPPGAAADVRPGRQAERPR